MVRKKKGKFQALHLFSALVSFSGSTHFSLPLSLLALSSYLSMFMYLSIYVRTMMAVEHSCLEFDMCRPRVCIETWESSPLRSANTCMQIHGWRSQ